MSELPEFPRRCRTFETAHGFSKFYGFVRTFLQIHNFTEFEISSVMHLINSFYFMGADLSKNATPEQILKSNEWLDKVMGWKDS